MSTITGWEKILISVWRNKLTGNYFIDKKALKLLQIVEDAVDSGALADKAEIKELLK